MSLVYRKAPYLMGKAMVSCRFSSEKYEFVSWDDDSQYMDDWLVVKKQS